MIEITSDAIERVGTLLADVPKGAERVFANAMNRGISRVKTQALKRTKQVYTVNGQVDVAHEYIVDIYKECMRTNDFALTKPEEEP